MSISLYDAHDGCAHPRAGTRSGTDSPRTSWSGRWVARRRTWTAGWRDAAGRVGRICSRACVRTRCGRRSTRAAGRHRAARTAGRRRAAARTVCPGTSRPGARSCWAAPQRRPRCPAGGCLRPALRGNRYRCRPSAPWPRGRTRTRRPLRPAAAAHGGTAMIGVRWTTTTTWRVLFAGSWFCVNAIRPVPVLLLDGSSGAARARRVLPCLRTAVNCASDEGDRDAPKENERKTQPVRARNSTRRNGPRYPSATTHLSPPLTPFNGCNNGRFARNTERVEYHGFTLYAFYTLPCIRIHQDFGKGRAVLELPNVYLQSSYDMIMNKSSSDVNRVCQCSKAV